MVFCDTKFNTATLANQLARLGFSVDCLHGDLSQKSGTRSCSLPGGQAGHLWPPTWRPAASTCRTWTLSSTTTCPSDNEHYTHRIGRTGRAKKEGVSYLLYVPEEKKRVQELLRLTRNTDLCTPVHFDFNHEHIVVEKRRTAPTGSRSNAISKIKKSSLSLASKSPVFCLRGRLGEFLQSFCKNA